MPSVQDTLRDAMVTLMNTVDDVGFIYPHYKYSSDWNYFLDQFGWVDANGNKGIRGWWFSLPPITTGRFSTFQDPTDAYDWTIRGISSARDKDDTETDFGNLIYSVRDVIRRSLTLGLGGEVVIPGTVTCELPLVDIRMFGSVMAHYAELRVRFEALVPAFEYTA